VCKKAACEKLPRAFFHTWAHFDDADAPRFTMSLKKRGWSDENRVCSEETLSLFLSSAWIEIQRGTESAEFEAKWTKWNDFIGCEGSQSIWVQRFSKFSYHDIWLWLQVLILSVGKLVWVPVISFGKIFISSYAFDALLCWNWPFSPPDRLTLRIAVLLPGINLLLELFQLVPFSDFLSRIFCPFLDKKWGKFLEKRVFVVLTWLDLLTLLEKFSKKNLLNFFWKEQPWSHITMSLFLCHIFAISVKLIFEKVFWYKHVFSVFRV
jgi:hypothetical protein